MYNVVIWDGTREVGIDADGTRHELLEQAEVFDHATAKAVAEKFRGSIVDAFGDDGWDDDN